MEISVVMSVYKNDNPSHFELAVESVLEQTYLPKEIIIVIDGEVSEELNLKLDIFFKNFLVRIIRLNENKGLANALNIGIKNASFPLIARMDSDDICFNDRLEKQVKALNEFDLDIVGGQIVEFGKDTNDLISRRIVPCRHSEMVKLLKFRSPFSHPTIVFRKEVFERLNGYDENIFPEDYDFFVRAYLAGFRFGNVQENVMYFRLGENLSEAIKRRWGLKYAINEFRLYNKFLKLGFFNYMDYLKVIFFKIPLRIIPFKLYSYIYFKFSR